MKRLLFFILLLLSVNNLCARHLKGGFFSYTYLGPGISNPSNLRYKITLTEYMDCNAEGRQIDESVQFTFFNASSGARIDTISVALKSSTLLSKKQDEICITGNQAVCFYRVVVYELSSYELPVSPAGYIISHQRCCRIENMDNIRNSGAVGNTYSIQIPGTQSQVTDANKNSSPIFPVNDTVVICENSYFEYKVNATDPDGDKLSYGFCDAFLGGSANQPAPEPSSTPPFNSVPYLNPFSGESPLGDQVTINAETGLMSGIAPSITARGEFVVTICVNEYRNNLFMAQSKKELHVKVENCVPLQARLAPKAVTCDGFNVSFSNSVTNPSGTLYEWDFNDAASGILNKSNEARPSHTYTDTGVYIVKLKVSLNGLCADSTTLQVKVYPGFFPAISTQGAICVNAPAQFLDATTTRYGSVTGWRWDFGDAVTGDTSNNKNPTYTYKTAGTYKVKLIVGNTFGCIDTTEKDISVLDKLPLGLPGDTLICTIDTIQLNATGAGSFTWSPNYMINNLHTGTPLISPDAPTMYYVSFLDAQGCTGNDSVFVDVKSFVTINAGNDTTICRTDAIKINTFSDALSYTWEPSTYLDNDKVKQPIATPLDATITYKVTGSIGKCHSSDFITINTVPYPVADAGNDTLVCYEQPVQLYATGGITYSWSPAVFLNATTIANPQVIKPTADTRYIVTITGNKGCPKPVKDTVLVQVYPKVVARISNDTSIVIGQPLQIITTGAKPDDIYTWSPSQWLSSTNVMNPIATPERDITYTMQLVTRLGNCTGGDTIKVKVFMLEPSFYVPTAFSPNNDGINEILKPIALGIRKLSYFRVYNRAGTLLFATTRIGEGWDGTYKGNPQDPANYVWMAQGETYKGEVITKKGNAVLVR